MTNTTLPPLCQKCSIAHKTESIIKSCPTCTKLKFSEWILCELNEIVQADSSSDFTCKAFRPNLQSVGSIPKKVNRHLPLKEKDIPEVSEDALKYLKAMSLQKIKQDPDAVIMNLKYHIVWPTRQRMKIFTDDQSYKNIIEKSFLECADDIGGIATIIQVAIDHIHIYLNVDGEKSVDNIIKTLKESSAKALSQLKGIDYELWDDSYLSETIM